MVSMCESLYIIQKKILKISKTKGQSEAAYWKKEQTIHNNLLDKNPKVQSKIYTSKDGQGKSLVKSDLK